MFISRQKTELFNITQLVIRFNSACRQMVNLFQCDEQKLNLGDYTKHDQLGHDVHVASKGLTPTSQYEPHPPSHTHAHMQLSSHRIKRMNS